MTWSVLVIVVFLTINFLFFFKSQLCVCSFQKTASFCTVGIAGQLPVVSVGLQRRKMLVYWGGRTNSKAQVHLSDFASQSWDQFISQCLVQALFSKEPEKYSICALITKTRLSVVFLMSRYQLFSSAKLFLNTIKSHLAVLKHWHNLAKPVSLGRPLEL